MLSGLDLLHLVFITVFMLVFILTAFFTLYVMFKALRSPKFYPPPRPSASELVGQLMCPKCGSKELEPVGYYTIRCKSCGFMFHIGRGEAYPYCLGWWFWPILWWPLFWIWPITWFEKR